MKLKLKTVFLISVDKLFHEMGRNQLLVRLQGDETMKRENNLDQPIGIKVPSMTDPRKLKYQLTPFKTPFLQSRAGL